MSVEIGNAYDFSDIAGDEQILWTCLSRSRANDRILKLAPTVSEQPTCPAVGVQSDGGSKAWLIPAISVAVHHHDLEMRTIASRFNLIPADLDIESMVAMEDAPDKDMDDLQNIASNITRYFHANPDRQVLPDIKDCLVLEKDSLPSALAFGWRHDKNRQYVLRSDGSSGASLKQKYDPRGDLRWPADAPLKVGPTTIKFAADGSTVDKLSSSEVKAISAAFDWKTETKNMAVSRTSRSRLSVILESLVGSWKTAAAAGFLAAIVSTVILLQQAQVPTYEVYQAYATTGVRGGVSDQPGVILELRAVNVAETTSYFADILRDAGITTTVEDLPGDGMIVTGNGRIDASDHLRDLLTVQDINLDDRVYIEIVIQRIE